MIVFLIFSCAIAYIGLGFCIAGILDCAGVNPFERYTHATITFWPLILLFLLIRSMWLGVPEMVEFFKDVIYNR